ncbi:hypothetical protein ACLOJK_022143 [Asimina triloba]
MEEVAGRRCRPLLEFGSEWGPPRLELARTVLPWSAMEGTTWRCAVGRDARVAVSSCHSSDLSRRPLLSVMAGLDLPVGHSPAVGWTVAP